MGKMTWTEMVEEFLIARGDKIPERILSSLPEDVKLLRVRLCMEELSELVIAIHENDTIGALDGIADSLYVIIGTAIAHGFGPALDDAFREVHRSNMTKSFPVRDSSHKSGVKGTGYSPADLTLIVNRHLLHK